LVAAVGPGQGGRVSPELEKMAAVELGGVGEENSGGRRTGGGIEGGRRECGGQQEEED